MDVAFEHIPERVAVGTLANVTLQLPAVEHAEWLPAAALQSHERQRGVWTVREGRAHFQPVKTDIQTLDGKVQILSGLDAGARVISYMRAPLREDQRVRIEQP